MTSEEIHKMVRLGPKVVDHCHWSGAYRGAAHSGCNIAMRKSIKIPIIFHNLGG